jgi:hypothetical protein
MTQTEALRLAFEALAYINEGANNQGPHTGISWRCAANKSAEALNTIKAALEAKDEPVACKECHLKDTVYDLLGDLKVANLKLSVRSKRTWVGLTEQEQHQLWTKWIESMDGWGSFYRTIEAKLKEKNT